MWRYAQMMNYTARCIWLSGVAFSRSILHWVACFKNAQPGSQLSSRPERHKACFTGVTCIPPMLRPNFSERRTWIRATVGMMQEESIIINSNRCGTVYKYHQCTVQRASNQYYYKQLFLLLHGLVKLCLAGLRRFGHERKILHHSLRSSIRYSK
jgi:hypothetical protein